MPENTHPLKLFYCYARQDKAFRDDLDLHLSGLKRQGLLSTWHDFMITPGEEWEKVIDTQLNEADIIVLLVSPHFIASDYCYGKEMVRALERHDKGEARVIPVLARPADWTRAPFSKIQLLPSNSHAITRWPERDSAFEDVAHGIRAIVEKLSGPSEREEKSLEKGQENQAHYYKDLALCEEAIRTDPTNAVAYGAKGYALLELGRLQEALTSLDEAIRLNPTYTSAYFNKGKTLALLGRHKESVVAIDEAIHLNAASDDNVWQMPIFYQTKGYVLRVLGRYEEALAAFRETIRFDPTISTSHSGLSDILHSLGRYEEAARAAEEAIRLDRSNVAAYRYKGNALAGLGRYEEAIAAFDRVIAFEPGSAEAYCDKGKTLALAGRLQESLAAYNRALQFVPGDSGVQRDRQRVVDSIKNSRRAEN